MVSQISLWDDQPLEIEPPACLTDLLVTSPKNTEIQSTICNCYDHIKNHKMIMCSISGGYDSDIVMDLIIRCGGGDKTAFVFNDTGLEYDATKEHIAYLARRYGVDIVRLSPKKAIPTCCREYGAPFWSKYVSSMISRLQRHGFCWEDKPLVVLLSQYPNCRSALRWWCDDFKTDTGRPSKFNIEWTHGLKEFMVRYPPDFPVSARCCEWAKKNPTHDYLIAGGFGLNVTGIRVEEGGQRSTSYKSCFDKAFDGPDNYRPLFWWTDKDKEMYRKYYRIVRSDCYEIWGMERTGCAGCPCGKDFEAELDLVKVFEPKHYKAMCAVFGQSYDYTRRYLEFRKCLKIKTAKKDETQTEIEGVK